MIEIKTVHAATVLEQVTKLIGAVLSWPTTVVVLMFIFRRPIARLIDSTEEWSGFGQTVKRRLDTVGKQLSEAEAVTPVIIASTGTARGSSTAVGHSTTIYPDSANQQHHSTSPSLSGTTKVSEAVSPQERILKSWQKVEDRVRQVAVAHGLEADTPTSLWEAAKQLTKSDVFDGQILGLLSHLRKLRDAAASGGAVSNEDAARYSGFVIRLLGLIANV